MPLPTHHDSRESTTSVAVTAPQGPRRILRTPAAAEYLGVATATLEKQRIKGGGPRFIKIGPKLVGYTIEDLDAHIEAGRRTSTSDPGGAASETAATGAR
jgi:predicted DNA-binding transcriptional regulator AlpA